MEITAGMVKELREKTGVGMMDCKKALAETDGDIDKAVELLRKKGLAAAAKKAGRVATEGLVGSFVAPDGKLGALIEVNCETDFVARNADFQELVAQLAQHVATTNPANLDALLASQLAGGTVADLVNQKVAKIGEKIDVRRFDRYALKSSHGQIGAYIHLGGKIGVLVELESTADAQGKPELVELAREVAMQIAASNPTYVGRDEVPAEAVENERRILAEAEDIKSKPEAVRPKIVEGRLNRFYEQVCLVDQPYIKDPAMTVSKMLEARGQKLGGPVKIVRFARYVLGEGLEKKKDDFAAEVMAQVGGR